MRIIQCVACLVLFTFLFVNHLLAVSLAGVDLADKLNIHEKELVLNGAGVRKATIFGIKVYVAGLYLESRSSEAETILASAGVKYLEMRFVRDVEADKLQDGWLDGFKKNSATIKPIEKQISIFNSWMSDIQEGQSIKLSFVNDLVDVEVAGRHKGSIEGKAFSQALLGIWLGDHPPNEELKKGLLGLS